MSNNIYDILNKFNAVDQHEQQPVEQQPKAKSKLAENMETVEGQLNEKYMGFKKTVAAIKKGGSAENPEAVAAAIGRKKYGKEKFQQAAAAGKKLGEGEVEESGLQAYLGKKKYGEEGMKALQKAGREGASKEKMAMIRAKHDKMDEVAPPGAKAERMVKHIKKGYAKDGKLTDREKGIAYATAWKAHKAGKVEEAVAALSILTNSGMTAEQITEGWEDMMKAVKKQHDTEKGTGKFDKKKDPTTGGTVYTRKYNPKSGETDDTENVTAVKRGRGRPKKSAFEQYTDKFENMLEDADPLGKFIQNLDKKGEGAKVTKEPMGTIKGGVWTPDAPKPGEKGVPLPQPVDEEMTEMMRLAGLEEVSKGEYLKQQDAAAEKAGKGTFKAFGQEFSTDEIEEGSEMCRECGYTMTECGCDSPVPDQDQGHMNVSMNVDSDGHQSLSVSADGEDAAKLAQLLKLAGLGSGEAEAVYQPVEVEVDGEEEIEEEKDDRYHASTTPDVEVFSTDVQLKGGNGDVAGQEKKMTPHGYQFGDNPIAMKETVARDYESIKVKK